MSTHKTLTSVVRRLRQRQTDAERLMWSLLRTKRFEGFKFRRQHPMNGVVLDFYCASAQLCIELDGGQHFEPDALERDRQRDAMLAARGISVLRFEDYAFFTQRDAVMQRIFDTLHCRGTDPAARPSPNLSPAYRGEGPDLRVRETH